MTTSLGSDLETCFMYMPNKNRKHIEAQPLSKFFVLCYSKRMSTLQTGTFRHFNALNEHASREKENKSFNCFVILFLNLSPNPMKRPNATIIVSETSIAFVAKAYPFVL